MLPIVAIVVALACIFASARRLVFALTATSLDPTMVLAALRGDRDAARTRLDVLRAAIATDADSEWEREFFGAFDAPLHHRNAIVNEQLSDLDFRLQRWARVPRVCARVTTSAGFLLASLALRNGLAGASELEPAVREHVVYASLGDAINVVAVGICGAVFCVAFQARAQSAAKIRLAAIDKLVERVELLGLDSASLSVPEGEGDAS